MRTCTFVFFTLATVAASGSLGAQERDLRIGVAAGGALQSVPGRDDLEAGGLGRVSVQIGGVSSPAALRVDGMYIRFTEYDVETACERQELPGCPDVRSRNDAIAGILNGTWSFPRARVAPYVIAGAGLYARRVAVTTENLPCTDACAPEYERFETDTDWTTDFGLSGGLGLLFGTSPVALSVEARVHHIFLAGENASIFPVVVGVWF